MDNFTHAFIGLAVGEVIHRALPAEPDEKKNSLRRTLLLFISAVASNFPDLDLVLSPLLPAPLGYLLHHRGHTHTFLYAIPQALFLALATTALWPSARKLLQTDRAARFGFLIALTLGFVLHLALDTLNSYGIHPFHPVISRWYYGDMVFIIEPIFWATVGVAAVSTFKTRWLKFFWLAFLLGVPTFFTITQYLNWASLALILTLGGLVLFSARHAHERSLRTLILAFGLSLAFISLQGYLSKETKFEAKTALELRDAGYKVLDISTSSFPSQPFCWAFHSISVDEANNSYRLRSGILSLIPNVMTAKACPEGLSRGRDITGETDSIVYHADTSGDLRALRNRHQSDCFFNAWMRFARMPMANDEGAFDTRFVAVGDRQNFTSITFADFQNQVCPENVPPWTPPREDLLTTPSSQGVGSDIR